jgi:type I restriction enzyme S subunit
MDASAKSNKEKSLYRPYFPDEWERKILFDLAEWKNGLVFRDISFSDDGMPVIKITELKNGITGQTKFTNQTFNDTVFLTKNDMVFSWSGNPETSIDVFWYNLPEGWLNQHIFKVTVKEGVDEDFFFYILKYLKPNFINIASNKQTTGLGHVTINDLKQINVGIPPHPSTQRAIAATLSCLDDKIALNHRINDNLEAQTQGIYEQFFGFCSSPIIPIGEIIDVRDGTHESPKPVDNGLPLVTSKHLLSYGVDSISPNRISEADFDKINERSKVDTYDILISMIGTVGLISLVIEDNISFAIKNVGLFKTSQKKDWVYFILCHLRSPAIKQHIDMRLAGSTQKYISLGELRQIPVTIPAETELKKFDDTVRPIFEEIIVLTKANYQLAAIRDTLLPKLMSGELEVEEEESL